jgi:asparagine synthase (glutamine-hydrolysing)
LLELIVPSSLIQGPKKGFSVPLAEWLRGPLKGWADDLLSEDSVMKAGILDPKKVQSIWQEHLIGKKNLHHILWGILMFQAWYAAQ